MGMIRNAAACAVLAAAAAGADEAAESAQAQGAPAASADLAEVLKRRLPDVNVTAVGASPIPGFLVVEIEGGVMLHVTEDGSYAIAGVLYALTDQGPVDPFEPRRAAKRLALIADVPVDQMIVFAPVGETRAVLNVFTDPDCGFCRKLHAEVPELNSYGIEVRYLAFPRMGIGSETYDRLVSAWCAENPQDAMTDLKLGRKIPSNSCQNPVAEQYEMGKVVGVEGTPTMVTADGELIGGYVPAAQLAQGLGLK